MRGSADHRGPWPLALLTIRPRQTIDRCNAAIHSFDIGGLVQTGQRRSPLNRASPWPRQAVAQLIGDRPAGLHPEPTIRKWSTRAESSKVTIGSSQRRRTGALDRGRSVGHLRELAGKRAINDSHRHRTSRLPAPLRRSLRQRCNWTRFTPAPKTCITVGMRWSWWLRKMT